MEAIISHFSTNKWFVLVLFAGLCLNVTVLASIHETNIANDEVAYNYLAKNILEGRGFISEYGKPTSMRPPLYPLLLVGTYSLFGIDNYKAVWWLQIILHLATGFLVYQQGKILFSSRVGLLASGLYIFYPSLIGFNFLLMSETLFNFLFTFSLFLFSYFLKKDKNFFLLILSGIMFGLTALTRTVALPVVGVLALFLLFIRGWRIENLKSGFLNCLIFLSFFVIIISPWVWRNTKVQGSFTMIDTMGGLNFMMGNYKYTPLNRAWAAVGLQGKESWAYELQVTGNGKHMSEKDKQKWATQRGLQYIIENPRLTIKRSLIKALDFWGQERVIIASLLEGHWGKGMRPVVFLAAGAIFLSYTVLFPTSCFGLGFAYSRTKIFSIFLGLLFLTLTFLHAIVFGHPRYHLPLIPSMAILSSYAIINWSQLKPCFIKARFTFWLCLIWVLFVAVGWFRTIFFVDLAKITKGLFF